MLDPDRRRLSEITHSLREGNEHAKSEILTLSDGREMGYVLYGAQTGPSVFYLHGLPGCRLSGVFFDDPGKRLGARIIAVERPGIGISSPQPGREIKDHVSDIQELAEYLHIDSYGIIGVSGGGPYALACAYHLPEQQLKSVSIMCGLGPIDIGLKGMSWSNWLTFQSFIYCPALVRWVHNKVVTVLNTMPNEKIAEMTQAGLQTRSAKWFGPSQKDASMLNDIELSTLILEFYREHYKQGVEGFMEDGRVLTSDLGFRLEDIRPSLPIQLWYGRQDSNVPLSMGREIEKRLVSPNLFIKDETHLSLILEFSFDALKELLESM